MLLVRDNISVDIKVSSSVGRTNVTWWRGEEFVGEGELSDDGVIGGVTGGVIGGVSGGVSGEVSGGVIGGVIDGVIG